MNQPVMLWKVLQGYSNVIHCAIKKVMVSDIVSSAGLPCGTPYSAHAKRQRNTMANLTVVDNCSRSRR